MNKLTFYNVGDDLDIYKSLDKYISNEPENECEIMSNKNGIISMSDININVTIGENN